MVDSLEHETKRCIRSEALSVAMREVPREAFVGDDYAYADRTGECHGTRVLAPSTAARLLEAVAPAPDDNILIVGVGVGYTAAVLAEIVGPSNVQAIDIDRRLVYEARSNLERAGYEAVLVDAGDGADGLPAYAPYDRVVVEAAAIKPPTQLLNQLTPTGRLVLPLGGGEQTLSVIVADDGRPEVLERRGTTAFAPMLIDGEQANTVERNRTHREDREFANRAQERRRGWEQDWIDWDRF